MSKMIFDSNPIQDIYDTYVDLKIISKCNYRCKYCFNKKSIGVKKRLSSYSYLVLAKELSKINNALIAITGGEPFLFKNIIEFTKNIENDISIETNLSTKNLYKFASKINPLKIYRIIASYHHTQSNTQEFIEKVKFLKDNNFNVIPRFVLYPPYLDEYKKLSKLFNAEGIDIYPKAFKGYYQGKKYPESYTIDEVKLLNQKQNSKLSSFNSYITNNHKNKMCTSGKKLLVIDEFGNVYNCHNKNIKLGHLINGYKMIEKHKCTENKSVCPQLCLKYTI